MGASSLPTITLLILISLAAGACSTRTGPGAPVVDGSFMTFDVVEAYASGGIQYDVKLAFKQTVDGFRIDLSSTHATLKTAEIRVDSHLIPADNIVREFDLGRLWLPPEGRAVGKRTPCGTVGEQRKYKNWDVWP